MATDSSMSSDWNAFSQFVAKTLGGDLAGLSLEESLAKFRAYQRDLDALRAKVQVAIDQADRGEARPLDDTSFWAEVDQQLDELGVPE